MAAGGKDVIILSSSPPLSTAPRTPTVPRAPDPSHEGFRQLTSEDNDLHIAVPKHKRVKAATSSQKVVAAKSERKVKEVSEKGKGKEAVGKGGEGEREASSVESEEDEELKPKPAYRCASAPQESLPESQKKVVISVGKHAAQLPTAPVLPIAGSNPVPVGSTTDSETTAVPAVLVGAAPSLAPVAPPTHPVPHTAVTPPVPTPVSARLASDDHYLQREPHPPPHGYAVDKHIHHFYHRPLVRAMDNHYGMQPPTLYRDQGQDFRETEAMDFGETTMAIHHAHMSTPGGQPSYAALPPTAYNQYLRHDPHQQLGVAAAPPRGPTANAMAPSSIRSSSQVRVKGRTTDGCILGCFLVLVGSALPSSLLASVWHISVRFLE
ncbi:hypothetical protein PILCRDRAFT_15433 [Piloderma croceum F 1598]|uniref:Uncharacterized protein n=1 Tax=Piloderma croceum (strain F 1598) TaxID=765440 RepID=A0A0C3EZQ2_PILCF|nr:hypothetical protein PILCRDRAFT_15433 [Piloderma croceum F 1598]